MNFKKINTKALILFIVPVFFLLLVGLFIYAHRSNPFEIIRRERYTQPLALILDHPLDPDAVTCEFRVTSYFQYKNSAEPWKTTGKIINFKTVEDIPTTISFSGLYSNEPRIKGNMGIRSLTKIKDDDETLVLVEKNMVGDIFTHTIYKKDKIAVWSQTYPLLGNPLAMLSMGYCY